jgi:hypothetical protein
MSIAPDVTGAIDELVRATRSLRNLPQTGKRHKPNTPRFLFLVDEKSDEIRWRVVHRTKKSEQATLSAHEKIAAEGRIIEASDAAQRTLSQILPPEIAVRIGLRIGIQCGSTPKFRFAQAAFDADLNKNVVWMARTPLMNETKREKDFRLAIEFLHLCLTGKTRETKGIGTEWLIQPAHRASKLRYRMRAENSTELVETAAEAFATFIGLGVLLDSVAKVNRRTYSAMKDAFLAGTGSLTGVFGNVEGQANGIVSRPSLHFPDSWKKTESEVARISDVIDAIVEKKEKAA